MWLLGLAAAYTDRTVHRCGMTIGCGVRGSSLTAGADGRSGREPRRAAHPISGRFVLDPNS